MSKALLLQLHHAGSNVAREFDEVARSEDRGRGGRRGREDGIRQVVVHGAQVALGV